MSTKRVLTAEATQLIIYYMGGLLIGLVGTILLTRALGPEDRGIYAWLLTLGNLGTFIAMLAQYNLIRKLGAEKVQNTWSELIGPLIILNTLGGILSIPLFVWAWQQPLGQQHFGLLVLVWLNVPCVAVLTVFSAFIHLRRQAWDTLLSNFIIKLILVVLIFLGWYFDQITLSLSVFLSTIFIGLLSLLILYSYLNIPWRQWQWNFNVLRGHGQFLGAGWLAGLATFAAPKVPLLLLPHYVSLTELGHFSLATTLLDIALLVPTAATSVLISHFARSGGATTTGQQQAFWALLALCCVMAIFGYISAPYLLPWVFGPAFSDASEPFRWLLLALLLQAPIAVMSSAATARGQAQSVVWPPFAGLVTTFITTLLLLSPNGLNLGLTGACWAIIAGYAMQLLAFLVLRTR